MKVARVVTYTFEIEPPEVDVETVKKVLSAQQSLEDVRDELEFPNVKILGTSATFEE